MSSGLRSAVSGFNHAEKHRGPQTAAWIATEANANSSLIMRHIRTLLRLLSVLAAGSHNESKYHRDLIQTDNLTTISITVY